MKKRMAAGLAALMMGLTATALPVQALSLGNVNGDGAVNASDAAVVLIASAAMGAGRSSGLSSAQLQAANVNGDSAVNATDAAVILIYAAAAGAGSNQTLEEYLGSQGKTQYQQYADEVVRLVNVERKKAGLDPLYAAPVLNQAAQIRAQECTKRIDETHKRPDGRDWNTVLAEVGITNVTCGENVAMGFATPERVVNAWMNSSAHKANILKSAYTCIGVGVAEQDGYLYWAQEFTGGVKFDGAYLP